MLNCPKDNIFQAILQKVSQWLMACSEKEYYYMETG